MNFIYVGLGGAAGAALRYAVSLIPYRGEFPFLTLATNLLGAFLIGIISGIAEKKGVPDPLLLFFKTGMCGGFTTFSTFSLESYQLFQARHTVAAVVYMVLSVCLCLCGVIGGRMLSAR